MGAFDRFKEAVPMGIREYIQEGIHFFLIRSSMLGESENPTQPKGTEKCVVEFKVIASDTVPVGKMMSMVEMSTSQGFYGNVLAYVAGVLGMDIDEMKADPEFDGIFTDFFGETQLSTGMLVKCTAQVVKTTSKSAKSPTYTAKTWEPVDAREYEKYGLIAPNGSWTAPEAAAQ